MKYLRLLGTRGYQTTLETQTGLSLISYFTGSFAFWIVMDLHFTHFMKSWENHFT